jgi:hypothetical protein
MSPEIALPETLPAVEIVPEDALLIAEIALCPAASVLAKPLAVVAEAALEALPANSA